MLSWPPPDAHMLPAGDSGGAGGSACASYGTPPSAHAAPAPRPGNPISRRGSAELPSSSGGSGEAAPAPADAVIVPTNPNAYPAAPYAKGSKGRPAGAWDSFMGALGVPRKGGRSSSGASTPGTGTPNPREGGAEGSSRRGSLEGDLGADVRRLAAGEAGALPAEQALPTLPSSAPPAWDAYADARRREANGGDAATQPRAEARPASEPDPGPGPAPVPSWQGQVLPVLESAGAVPAAAGAAAAAAPTGAPPAARRGADAAAPAEAPAGGLGRADSAGHVGPGSGCAVSSGRLVRGSSRSLSDTPGAEGSGGGFFGPAPLPSSPLDPGYAEPGGGEPGAGGGEPGAAAAGAAGLADAQSDHAHVEPDPDPEGLEDLALPAVRAPRAPVDMVALYSMLRPPKSPFLDSGLQAAQLEAQNAAPGSPDDTDDSSGRADSSDAAAAAAAAAAARAAALAAVAAASPMNKQASSGWDFSMLPRCASLCSHISGCLSARSA